MKIIKYLFPFWIGVFVYTVFSILKGPVGIASYSQLKTEHEKLLANLETLRRINKELETAKNMLLYDEETIVVYARDLGYKREGERFIRIVGFDGTKKQRTDPGSLVTASEPDHISDTAIKICAFCIAAGAFLCIFIPDLIQRRAKSKNSRQTGAYSRHREGRRRMGAKQEAFKTPAEGNSL
ncbi:MAG: septum formation initiator family protein [Spirochaetaceae bacterium]|jgi:cell division protein FtsB|nr:septum formation initiator family protein [Spirochaetaceae bacterium]